MFLDLEQTVVDEVRIDTYRQLFYFEKLISGEKDAVKNFARGQYNITREIVIFLPQKIRKLVDNCTEFKDSIASYSQCNCTGSSLGSFLWKDCELIMVRIQIWFCHLPIHCRYSLLLLNNTTQFIVPTHTQNILVSLLCLTMK